MIRPPHANVELETWPRAVGSGATLVQPAEGLAVSKTSTSALVVRPPSWPVWPPTEKILEPMTVEPMWWRATSLSASLRLTQLAAGLSRSSVKWSERSVLRSVLVPPNTCSVPLTTSAWTADVRSGSALSSV